MLISVVLLNEELIQNILIFNISDILNHKILNFNVTFLKFLYC